MSETRILRETLEGTFATALTEPVGTIQLEGGSWQTGTATIAGQQYHIIFNNGYFDLSGYTLEDKTLFTTGAIVQQVPPVYGQFSGFSAHLMSTEPLNLDNFENTSPSGNWQLPGMMGSTYSLQQIILGSSSSWALDSTTNSPRVMNGATWGLGDSTAREKLYYAVAWAIPKALAGTIMIPDTSFVVPSIVEKEPDLEYIMRLARSVEAI